MSTRRKVAEMWAAGKDANYSRVNMFSCNGVLYSYRTEIARICEGVTTLNRSSYSVSTSSHQSMAAQAIDGPKLTYWVNSWYSHGQTWRCRTQKFNADVSVLPRGRIRHDFLTVTRPVGDGCAFYISARYTNDIRGIPWLGNAVGASIAGIIGQMDAMPYDTDDILKNWVPKSLHAARQDGRLLSHEGLLFEILTPKRGSFTRKKGGRVLVGDTSTGRPVSALDVSNEDPDVFYGSIYTVSGRISRPDLKWWRRHRSPLHPTTI